MNDTGIIWTKVTWNPFSGCEKVSSGCAFCYAEKLAETKRGSPAFPNGFDLTWRPHKLKEPQRLKEPSLIFVNSMSDLFWERATDEMRDAVIDVMESTPQHEYQVLTKRPEVMLVYSRRRKLPPNFWAGVSVEDQPSTWRIDTLRQVEAEIRFVSCEPVLNPVELDLSGIDWLISGGESGAHLNDPTICARRGLAEKVNGKWQPTDRGITIVRSIRDQCIAQGVPFFHKQWGGYKPASGGRTLDGRTWDEFPRLPAGGGVNRRLEHKSQPALFSTCARMLKGAR